MYTTSILFEVVLISVSLTDPEPEPAGLLIPATADRLQVAVVPEMVNNGV
jgi:hypothetical protein